MDSRADTANDVLEYLRGQIESAIVGGQIVREVHLAPRVYWSVRRLVAMTPAEQLPPWAAFDDAGELRVIGIKIAELEHCASGECIACE